MEQFTKQLTAIRQGAASAPKKMVKSVISKQKGVQAAKDARDQEMIRENFGNEENYRKTFGSKEREDELYTPLYQKAGKAVGGALKGAKSFFDRLVGVRGGGK